MDTGQLALDDALDRVERNADEQWLVAADYAVAKAALRKAQLTADDVWDVLDGMDVATHEGRALGTVMRRAVKDGIDRGHRLVREVAPPQQAQGAGGGMEVAHRIGRTHEQKRHAQHVQVRHSKTVPKTVRSCDITASK